MLIGCRKQYSLSYEQMKRKTFLTNPYKVV